MDAIETLMNEHRAIERALDALVAFADDAGRRGATEAKELGRFVEFIRKFADACHHGKEEGILFAAMVDHGFPRDGGPIAMMLLEHDRGRALVSMLRKYAEAPGEWSAEDRRQITDAAHAYADLLRAHISKEDAILYPMAERHLPPETMRKVGEDCERFEEQTIGAGEHERLHALAEDLVARHAPTAYPHGHQPGA